MEEDERSRAETSLRAAGASVEKLRKARANSDERAALERDADDKVRAAKASVAKLRTGDMWVQSKLAAEVYRVEGELKRAKLLGANADPLRAAAAAGSGSANGAGNRDRDRFAEEEARSGCCGRGRS